MNGHVVEAPGTAPGSDRLITAAFIAIAGVSRRVRYMMTACEKKVALCEQVAGLSFMHVFFLQMRHFGLRPRHDPVVLGGLDVA